MQGRPRGFDPEEALSRAMHVFWRKGFDGTSLSDLESATGLGRQSLYGTFGDKRRLFVQAVEHYFAKVLQPQFIDVLDAKGSPRGNLENIFLGWENYACSSEFQGCLVGNSVIDLRATDPQLAELLRRKLRLMEDAFARCLSRAVKAGEVRRDLNPRETARTLLAIGQGLAVLARVQQERPYVRAIIDSARRQLD
ncbi:MAG: TetR/AcrR family transcriptional regulator [Polyangiaceae bacterium]